MAKIIVENATVERVFHTQTGSTGVSLAESYTPEGGEPRKSWFTAWFKRDPKLEVGQVVSVSGFHGVRSRTLDNGKTVFDVNVNGARLIDSAPPIQPAPQAAEEPWAEAWPSDDPWGQS